MATLPPENDRLADASPSVKALRGLVQKKQQEQRQPEFCELCSERIPHQHAHLLNLSSRQLVCACQACSLLFSEAGSGAGRYKLVPRRYLALQVFQMTDEQWDALMIPVNMAFLYRSTGERPVMAYYPSPAGATESLLDIEGWQALVDGNPILAELEPDVEALLINRVKHEHAHYIVPIDACYQLVGLIRRSWRGLAGGTEVWDAIASYFQEIRAKAEPVAADVSGADHA
jgi:hypothetical protein